jgi:hypothetical protein
MYKIIGLFTILVLLSVSILSCTKSPEETKPVLETTKSPASFAVSNLTVTPGTINSDETVTISVDIMNTGETAGNYTAALKINGSQEATQDVELEGGASKNVNFSISKNVPGDYTVSLDSLTGKFSVIDKTPPTKTITLSDADFNAISHLLTGNPQYSYSIHFLNDNKMFVDSYQDFNFHVKICDGKFCVSNVPQLAWQYIYSYAKDYLTYTDGDLLTLVSLPEKVAQTMFDPDTKVLPTITSITTSEGKITITYLAP